MTDKPRVEPSMSEPALRDHGLPCPHGIAPKRICPACSPEPVIAPQPTQDVCLLVHPKRFAELVASGEFDEQGKWKGLAPQPTPEPHQSWGTRCQHDPTLEHDEPTADDSVTNNLQPRFTVAAPQGVGKQDEFDTLQNVRRDNLELSQVPQFVTEGVGKLSPICRFCSTPLTARGWVHQSVAAYEACPNRNNPEPKGVEGVGQTAREFYEQCYKQQARETCEPCYAFAEAFAVAQTLTLRAELQQANAAIDFLSTQLRGVQGANLILHKQNEVLRSRLQELTRKP